MLVLCEFAHFDVRVLTMEENRAGNIQRRWVRAKRDGNRSTVVQILGRLQDGRSVVQIPAQVKDSSFLRNVLNDSDLPPPHEASNSMATEGKAAGA